MSKKYLLPFSLASESGRALANACDIKRIKRENSNWIASDGKIVINWGCPTRHPHLQDALFINTPEAVNKAANKLTFFQSVPEEIVPEYTDDIEEAEMWLEDGHCDAVVCREELRGHSGSGIVIAEDVDDLVDAPLYVQYVPKKQEWRVHVWNGVVFDVQRKARSRDVEDGAVNWKVRNKANGFVFVRNEDGPPPAPCVLDVAITAVESLDLHFGAVDVIYNQRRDMAYALEVNTAPGLEGTTLQKYANKINSIR